MTEGELAEIAQGVSTLPASRAVQEWAGTLEPAIVSLGARAGALCRAVVENESWHPVLRLRALELTRTFDRALAAELALHGLAWLEPQRAVGLLLEGLDPGRAWDVLADLWRRSPAHRALSGVQGYPTVGDPGSRAVLADERFVDLALSLRDADPTFACRLLATCGTPRASGELVALLHGTGDPAAPTCVAALENLVFCSRLHNECLQVLRVFLARLPAPGATPLSPPALGRAINDLLWASAEEVRVLAREDAHLAAFARSASVIRG